MVSPEQHHFEALSPEQIADKSYEQLLDDALQIGQALGVSETLQAVTIELLAELKNHDEQTARESLQTLPLAVRAAITIAWYYSDTAVDMEAVWATALLHDIGKARVPKETIDKSNAGQEWTESDAQIMSQHVNEGYAIAKEHGLPERIYCPIAESHSKQISRFMYGKSLELGYSQRITRDSVAIADFVDASLNRDNTRNAHLSYQDRLEQVYDDIKFVVDDYTNCDQLVEALYRTLTGHEHMQAV